MNLTIPNSLGPRSISNGATCQITNIETDKRRSPGPSRGEIPEASALAHLRGGSASMLELQRRILRVAPTTATVLLAGETGTGKEVVARAIHALSDRRDDPFIAVNCGAISAALIESELFGHEQGSFTGASRRHNGVFAQANGGTLFLDEITDMPVDLQVKLLRILESGSFQRIGGERAVQTDTRVIAAANRSPEAAVRDGKLREDLFYRLRVFPIALPPLRARDADVELLANDFLETLNRKSGTNKRFTQAALARLKAHSWPGNVRELKHFVHQAFILADRELDAESLRTEQPSDSEGLVAIRVGSSIAAAEKQLITATLDRFRGNKSEAAGVLGISLKTLYARLSVYKAER